VSAEWHVPIGKTPKDNAVFIEKRAELFKELQLILGLNMFYDIVDNNHIESLLC
jgi:hypothetical protein